MEARHDMSHHPCFNDAARHTHARVHLPVAPRCNIQCNFCNRKYDCVNETRPGVTSVVLSPRQALAYLEKVSALMPNLAVAGIAGPGDPFANPPETMETLELIHERFPGLLVCVATNGLGIMPHIPALARLAVSHVTVTINAVDPAVGAEIYAWARPDKRPLHGEEAARHLIDTQLAAVAELKRHGITVKINTIIIPGVNDHAIVDVAKTVGSLGADIMNCMPLYPAPGAVFESIGTPSPETVQRIRAEVKQYMPQMHHCTRCRADAAGMLGAPLSPEIHQSLVEARNLQPREDRPHVAVVTREGLLVNQHLGEAEEAWVYGFADGTPRLIERRRLPAPGGGDERWESLSTILKDCRLLLAAGAGANPSRILDKNGIEIILMEGMIDVGLAAAFGDGDFSRLKIMWEGCGSGCSGTGQGCG